MPNTINYNLYKKLRILLVLYAPAISLIYVSILWLSNDLHTTLDHQTYLLYACSVPIMLTLSKTLGMCRLHRFSILNPLFAPVIIWATPRSWDHVIQIIAIIITLLVCAMLCIKCRKNIHSNQVTCS